MCAIIIKYDEVFGNSDKIWDIDENGELIGYNGKGGAIAIPDGVKAVAKGAFRWNNAVTSVVFPASVKKIGDMAFFSCRALRQVRLTNNLSEIGESAFEACSELKKVFLAPEGAPEEGGDREQNEVKEDKKAEKTAAPSVEKPSGVIGKCAFAFCDELSSAELPSGITRIGPNVFEMCRLLKRATLPPFLESVGEMAFLSCEALEKCELPDTLKEIGALAFCYTAFEKVNLPDTVVSVGAEAFRRIRRLISVSLPAALEALPSGFLAGCPALKRIIYRGTAEMWERVTKDKNWIDTNNDIAIEFRPQ